jgi:hypothetical protein
MDEGKRYLCGCVALEDGRLVKVCLRHRKDSTLPYTLPLCYYMPTIVCRTCKAVAVRMANAQKYCSPRCFRRARTAYMRRLMRAIRQKER